MNPPVMNPTTNVAIVGIVANARDSVHCLSGCLNARASMNANGIHMAAVTPRPYHTQGQNDVISYLNLAAIMKGTVGRLICAQVMPVSLSSRFQPRQSR